MPSHTRDASPEKNTKAMRRANIQSPLHRDAQNAQHELSARSCFHADGNQHDRDAHTPQQLQAQKLQQANADDLQRIEDAVCSGISVPLTTNWIAQQTTRDKLLAALFLACALAAITSLVVAAAALTISAVVAILAGISGTAARTALVRVNAFFLLLMLTMPLQTSASPLVDSFYVFGTLQWGLQGFLAALTATCKGNAIMLFFLALPGTCSFSHSCKALHDLHMPEKLITLLHLVVRHAGTFSRELRALRTAASLRGFIPCCSLHTCRTTAYLAGMLLVRSYDKSLRIEQAMKLRGFTGKFPLLFHDEKASGTSFLFLGASGVLALLLLGCDTLYMRGSV